MLELWQDSMFVVAAITMFVLLEWLICHIAREAAIRSSSAKELATAFLLSLLMSVGYPISFLFFCGICCPNIISRVADYLPLMGPFPLSLALPIPASLILFLFCYIASRRSITTPSS